MHPTVAEGIRGRMLSRALLYAPRSEEEPYKNEVLLLPCSQFGEIHEQIPRTAAKSGFAGCAGNRRAG